VITNAFEIRSGGDLRVVSPGKLAGYAAPYHSLSRDLGGFVERIIPGAFKNSLSSPNHIRALLEHDPLRLLGRVGSHTLALQDDSKGLRFELSLPESIFISRQDNHA
jgi:HK97 family phage prohead protease